MSKNKKSASRTFYRYSEYFKGKEVQEISAGSSISAVCRRYDIKNMSTVSKWIKKYGRTELLNTIIRVKMRSEDDKIKQLELEIKRLKISLADATLAKELLEKLVEVADKASKILCKAKNMLALYKRTVKNYPKSQRQKKKKALQG